MTLQSWFVQSVESSIQMSGQSLTNAAEPLTDLPETIERDGARNPVRVVEAAVGGVMGLVSAPLDVMNSVAAGMTNSISAALPSLPAAHLGSLYVGIPHAHTHPPSLVPPAPPVPLPSLGAILLGTCVKVLIGGVLPAARAGDIGIAPTCVGFTPMFRVFTGSSKVLIGGTRAARMTLS